MIYGSDINGSNIHIVVKKETHNLEYAIVLPISIIILVIFKMLNKIYLPPEYSIALFGVSFYTPLTWALFDVYSLYKTDGKYIYKVEIESSNFFFELLFGAISYLIVQITMYILDYDQEIFSLASIYYFMIAYFGVVVVRILDKRFLEIGGWKFITYGFVVTFLFLYLYTLLFIKLL